MQIKYEMAARALINRPAEVINAIRLLGRDWGKVMDNIKEWVIEVSSLQYNL